MLTKEDEKDINTKMANLADEYFRKTIQNATVEYFENLAVAFTYKQTMNLINVTDNLVKETEKLKRLTIGLLVATILLLGAAVIENYDAIIEYVNRVSG